MTDAPRRWDAADRREGDFIREPAFPWRLRLLRRIGRWRWLPYGQHRLLRSLLDPETAPHFLFEVDFFGQRYRGDLAHYIDWLVFCYGGAPLCELSLLSAATTLLRQHRPEPLTFFDVGANVGHHTLFMASRVEHVVAFEPLPRLIALIEEKLALNNIDTVKVVSAALGDNDEDRNYFVGRGANSGEGSFLPTGDFDRGNLVKLAIRHGGRLCEARGLPRIDLMKVDVEGFEPFVFRGLAERIRRDRPIILTELSDTGRHGFSSEEGFRAAFYDDARFAEVDGGYGTGYRLRPFRFATSSEVVVMPPELGDLPRAGLLR